LNNWIGYLDINKIRSKSQTKKRMKHSKKKMKKSYQEIAEIEDIENKFFKKREEAHHQVLEASSIE